MKITRSLSTRIRPRRFGKTLALSMLRTFFEAEVDRNGQPVDNSRYFAGKKIMECGEDVLSQMGKYPVIKMSLKSAKQTNFYSAFLKLRDEIISEYSRHAYLMDSASLCETERSRFQEVLRGDLDWEERRRCFLNSAMEKEEFAKEVARVTESAFVRQISDPSLSRGLSGK